MQTNLFGEKYELTIQQAAKTAKVSTATIRNWIKTGYLKQIAKGVISQDSFAKFMSEVAGKEKLNARANKLLKNKDNYQEASDKITLLLEKHEIDKVGIAYENSLSDAYRNKEGIYYTPEWVVKDFFKNLKIHTDYRFLDPCCGVGNFIIEAIRQGVAPENVYGFDTDENAVSITKQRIKDEFGYDTDNIKVGDFLEEASRLKKNQIAFDLIFTNPPWGKKIEKYAKEKYANLYACGNSLDTTALFLGASLSILKPDGFLGFLVQEALANVAVFEDIRKKLLSKKILRIVDYGKVFNSLLTKAYGIVIEGKKSNSQDIVECCCNDKTFTRMLQSFSQNPKCILNFWVDESEAEVISQIYSIQHITLKNKAKWALGIVTGNNQKFCTKKNQEGYIPIYKGADITKSGLKEASTYILDDFSNFQQVAPLEMYRAKEKIIYKFISSELCFYCDTQQRYILNSANLLIPFGIEITNQQLTQLLNSEIINWLFKKLFATHKVLRGDLEFLPIHTEFFKTHNSFSEELYLDYLQIMKTGDGTYRVKR